LGRCQAFYNNIEKVQWRILRKRMRTLGSGNGTQHSDRSKTLHVAAAAMRSSFAVDSQLPRLRYMTRLDAFILTRTLFVFFSLIEVLLTTILNDNQQTKQATRIDRYCRVIFSLIFDIASISIFGHFATEPELKIDKGALRDSQN
jgi:hypothetical protein